MYTFTSPLSIVVEWKLEIQSDRMLHVQQQWANNIWINFIFVLSAEQRGIKICKIYTNCFGFMDLTFRSATNMSTKELNSMAMNRIECLHTTHAKLFNGFGEAFNASSHWLVCIWPHNAMGTKRICKYINGDPILSTMYNCIRNYSCDFIDSNGFGHRMTPNEEQIFALIRPEKWCVLFSHAYFWN